MTEITTEQQKFRMEKCEVGTREITDQDYLDFFFRDSMFASGDLTHAIETAAKVGLMGEDLADVVHTWKKDNEEWWAAESEDLDICYVIYDHIFQSAREHISDKIQEDIMDLGFSVYANSICTEFLATDRPNDKTTVAGRMEKIISENCSVMDINDLYDDPYVAFFFGQFHIEKEEILKLK